MNSNTPKLNKPLSLERETRRLILVSAGLTGLFSIFACSVYFASTLEDAFITFRYSEHLAEGYGLGMWNRAGEPVEGYTTPLWMFLLAACHLVSLPIAPCAKILGLLFHLGTFGAFFWLALRPAPARSGDWLPFPPNRHFRIACFATGIVMASSLPLAWYAVTGMELTLFTCVSTWVLLGPYLYRSAVLWSVLSGLLVLIRPEGIVIVIVVGALYALQPVLQRRMPKEVLPPLLTAWGVLLALTLFRLWYFGWPLPNTYYAKAEGAHAFHIRWGKKYVREFVAMNPLLMIAIGSGVLGSALELRVGRRLKKKRLLSHLLLGLFALSWFGYVIKTGGDNHYAFPLHRHFLHVAPVFVFLASLGIAKVAQGRFPTALFLALVLSAVDAAASWEGKLSLSHLTVKPLERYPTWSEKSKGYYRWFLRFKDSDIKIGAPVGGEMPFIVDARHIDLLGLNDPHIAHHGRFDTKAVVDSKSDMNYVLSLEPEIIASTVSARDIKRKKPRKAFYKNRRQMVREMFENPTFQEKYSLLLNGPYKSWDRAIFVRTDFCQRQSDFECLAVKKTSIAKP